MAAFPNTTDQVHCSADEAVSEKFGKEDVLGTKMDNLKPRKKPRYDASNYCNESDNSKQLDPIKMERPSFPVSQRKSQDKTLGGLESSNETITSHLSQTLIEGNTVEQGNAEAVKTVWNKDNAVSRNKEQPKVMQKPLLEGEKDHVKRDSDYMEPNPKDSIYKNRPVSRKERLFSLLLFLLLLKLVS